MYKYTQVLFIFVYCQRVLSWDNYGVPNSISSELFLYEEPQSNSNDRSDDRQRDSDDRSEPPSWIYKNHEKTQFSYKEPRSNYDDRITFPDEYKENNRDYTRKNTNSPRFILKCIRSCPLTDDNSPVCGTDDITYYNLDLLKCVRDCGDNVDFKHFHACNDQGTNTQPSTTARDNLKSCISTCPTTSEYNPVCGTDNVTYNNIGKLTCAQVCGVDVQLKRRLPCPKKELEDPFTTDAPIKTTTIDSRNLQSCIDSCITTSEYNPLCASNGKTYYNKGKFQCAKNCGLDILILTSGVCRKSSESSDIPSATTAASTTPQEHTTFHIDKELLDEIFSKENTDEPFIDVRSS